MLSEINQEAKDKHYITSFYMESKKQVNQTKWKQTYGKREQTDGCPRRWSGRLGEIGKGK